MGYIKVSTKSNNVLIWDMELELVELALSLKDSLKYRPLTAFNFEDWLLKHITVETSLGTYLREEVVSATTPFNRLVRCTQCGDLHWSLNVGDLVQKFSSRNSNLAEGLFVNYKLKMYKELTQKYGSKEVSIKFV